MKAAVIHEFGSVPRYEDFMDPVADAGDLIVRVKAVALENFDKMTAQGVHYASQHIFPQFPAIVGHSGVGALADGKLVFFGGTRPPYGTMAEKALVPKEYAAYATPLPEGVDPELAAALPASALTSLLPLGWGVKLEPGQTVLIQGATGVSGKLAVQIARLLGAGRIVGTGREDSILRSLGDLGATATIDLKQPDREICEAFAENPAAATTSFKIFCGAIPRNCCLARSRPAMPHSQSIKPATFKSGKLRVQPLLFSPKRCGHPG